MGKRILVLMLAFFVWRGIDYVMSVAECVGFVDALMPLLVVLLISSAFGLMIMSIK
jgi:hypothetical protein